MGWDFFFSLCNYGLRPLFWVSGRMELAWPELPASIRTANGGMVRNGGVLRLPYLGMAERESMLEDLLAQPGIGEFGTGPRPYGELSGNLPGGMQANHLNQNAVFGESIPSEEGLAIGMQGDALTQPGTQHYDFHDSLEAFWDQYRRGGSLEGQRPTNAEYGQALQRALEYSGYGPATTAECANAAAEQRALYGLMENDLVPRIPDAMR